MGTNTITNDNCDVRVNKVARNYKAIVSTIVKGLINGDIVPKTSRTIQGESFADIIHSTFNNTHRRVSKGTLFKTIDPKYTMSIKFGMVLENFYTELYKTNDELITILNYNCNHNLTQNLKLIKNLELWIDDCICITNLNESAHIEFDEFNNKTYLFFNGINLSSDNGTTNINLSKFENCEMELTYEYLDLEKAVVSLTEDYNAALAAGKLKDNCSRIPLVDIPYTEEMVYYTTTPVPGITTSAPFTTTAAPGIPLPFTTTPAPGTGSGSGSIELVDDDFSTENTVSI